MYTQNTLGRQEVKERLGIIVIKCKDWKTTSGHWHPPREGKERWNVELESSSVWAVWPQLQPCWRLIQLVTQRERQKQYDQLSSSKIISVSIMSSALNTNCLLLGLLPIRTIIKNYLPFVLSCPLSNNFLSLHFFYLRAGHLSSSWLWQTLSGLFFPALCSAESRGCCWAFPFHQHHKAAAALGRQMCGWAENADSYGSRRLIGTGFWELREGRC